MLQVYDIEGHPSSSKYIPVSNTHPVDLRQAVKDGEHKLGIALGVVWQHDGQCVHQHLVQALGEERLWQFP